MKFIPVTIEIEPDIQYLYECIAIIQKNAAIMGGYLCDLYLGTSYKDVDIFIKQDEVKSEKISALMERLGYVVSAKREDPMNEYGFSFFTHTYHKHNKKVQLIFTNKGIRHVKFFDIRMREFVYFKNTAYASVEALSDISKKMLVMGTSIDPFKAIVRAISFTKRYGYKIEKESLDLFYALFNEKRYKKERLHDIHEKHVKDIFIKILKKSQHTLDTLQLPTSYNVKKDYGNTYISHFVSETFEREIVEMIRNKKGEPAREQDLQITENEIEQVKLRRMDLVKKELRKKRLFLVTSNTDILNEVEAFCKGEGSISRLSLNVMMYNEKYQDLYKSIEICVRGLDWSSKLDKKNIKLTINTTIPFFPILETRNYARGNLESIKIENVGYVGYVLYNTKTKRVVKSDMDHRLSPWIQDLIEINKEKKAT